MKRLQGIQLAKEVLTLSSGTIGTLINNNNYKEIQNVQDAFYEFCISISENMTWQEAWEKFKKKENKKVEEKEMIKINNIIDTDYEDGTCWVEYIYNGLFGYEITEEYEEGDDDIVEEKINKCNQTIKSLTQKENVKNCSSYLAGIIEECRQSENDMWYLGYDDISNEICSKDEKEIKEFLSKINDEVVKLGLENYVQVDKYGFAIIVYGGVITKFLF